MATGGESRFSEEEGDEGGREVVRSKPVRERAMSSITKLLLQGRKLWLIEHTHT